MTAPRVVSLLPSATELLATLGGLPLLVGRSHECDFPSAAHPAGVDGLPILTAARIQTGPDIHAGAARAIDDHVRSALAEGSSLYTVVEALLASLRPDVILTQDLCEVCSVDLATVRRIAAGLSPAPSIVSLNPTTMEGVLDDLLTVGRAVAMEAQARSAMVALRERLHTAGEHVNPFADGINVAFLEWTDPLFVAGHWTVQLIERAGGRHPLHATRIKDGAGGALGPQMAERVAGKSFAVTPDQLVASQPEALIICPCGLDLSRTSACVEELARQAWWGELPAVRAGRVALVDGNQMFNRPGPRLVDAYEWLVGWLNDRPELIPPGFPARGLRSSTR